jgi:hypothetical protein
MLKKKWSYTFPRPSWPVIGWSYPFIPVFQFLLCLLPQLPLFMWVVDVRNSDTFPQYNFIIKCKPLFTVVTIFTLHLRLLSKGMWPIIWWCVPTYQSPYHQGCSCRCKQEIPLKGVSTLIVLGLGLCSRLWYLRWLLQLCRYCSFNGLIDPHRQGCLCWLRPLNSDIW